MNIDDVSEVRKPGVDSYWRAIFQKQRALMEKYADIERRNGANHPTPPYSIDDKFVQWRIKDELWRYTEELTEAHQVLMMELWSEDSFDGFPRAYDTSHPLHASLQHFNEEIADALHFIVEATIFAGLEEDAIRVADEFDWNVEWNEELQTHRLWWAVQGFGQAANLLKNKPWKSSHMLTDTPKFKHEWLTGWVNLLCFLSSINWTAQRAYEFYDKKNQVNEFRQRTNY